MDKPMTDKPADQHVDQAQNAHQEYQQDNRSAVDGQSPGPSEPTPTTMKKRMPLTNVACSECRKRKIKCDGGRPRCASCARRNTNECQYELDSSQTSRVAGYKSKIKQQETKIEQLENALGSLQKKADAGGQWSATDAGGQWSATDAAIGDASHDSPAGHRMPGRPSTPNTINPVPPLQDLHAREQEIIAFAHFQALERERFDREGLLLDQQRALKYENLQLKELLMLLTLMDDRALAQRMALRIREEGVTDNLLAQAQALYAGQPWHKIPPPLLRKTTSGSNEMLPSLRTLNLPPSQLASEIDPRLREGSPADSPR